MDMTKKIRISLIRNPARNPKIIKGMLREVLRQGHEGAVLFGDAFFIAKKTGAKRSPEWPARAPEK